MKEAQILEQNKQKTNAKTQGKLKIEDEQDQDT